MMGVRDDDDEQGKVKLEARSGKGLSVDLCEYSSVQYDRASVAKRD